MRVGSMDLQISSSDTSGSTSSDPLVVVPVPRGFNDHHHRNRHHHHGHGHGHHHHHHEHDGFHLGRIFECYRRVQGLGEEIASLGEGVDVSEVGEDHHHHGHHRGHRGESMTVNPLRLHSRHGERIHRKVSKRRHHGSHGHRRFKHGMMMRALISSSTGFDQEGGGRSSASGDRHGFPMHLLDMYGVELPASADSSSSSTRLLDIVEALQEIELGVSEVPSPSSSGGDPPCPGRHGRHVRNHHHHHHHHQRHYRHHHVCHRGRWIFVHEEPANSANPVDVVGTDGPGHAVMIVVPLHEPREAEAVNVVRAHDSPQEVMIAEPSNKPREGEAGPSATFDEKVAEGDITACEE
ncbi:hypothetical protein Mapa_006212 [Marchantia paleacea]|nr:hypothetical protein Mapa_006212 [Marchantia paleacea]